MRLTTGTVRFALPVARSPRWAAAVIIGMLLVIFLIDRRTGTAPVQHLYYLPIILAGTRFTLRGGIAGVIGRCLPPDAVACRYGGDEFAIAIPNCSEVQARHVGDDLCEAVRVSVPTLAGRVFPAATLTISVGVASTSTAHRRWGGFPTDDAEAGEWLFKQADRALYVAKTAGRDRVSVARRGKAHLNSRASTEEMESID
jgi:hypothetical protein